MDDRDSVTRLLEALPQDVAQRLREWLPRKLRISVARMQLDRLRGQLRIDELGTGTWKGRRITGEEIRIDMKADAIAFEKSRVELHVQVELGIQVPTIRAREPRIFKLGPVHESVSTPALPRIDLSSVAKEIAATVVLSSVAADEVTADVAPIQKVDAGEAEVEAVQVQEVTVPSQPLAFSGVSLGPVDVRGLGVDGGRASASTVQRAGIKESAKAKDVELRGATIVGGRAQSAQGGDLNLGFEVQLPALNIKTFPAMPTAIERFVTRLSVKIDPKVVIQIGNLRLEGLSLGTRVGTLRIGELDVPVDARGVKLDGATIEGARMEGIAVREEER